MKRLEKLLKDYEIYAKSWINDFGEGHLFLAVREELIPFEYQKKVIELDKQVLKIIESDESEGSDKFFLKKLKEIITKNLQKYHIKVA